MAVAPVERRTIFDHLSIWLSGGAGLTSGEFFAEFAAKKAALTGWSKAFWKGVIKTIWGSIWLWLASKIPEAKTRKYLEMVGYGSTFGILPDIIAAWYPGGISGIVTALALRRAVRRTIPTLRRAITRLPTQTARRTPLARIVSAKATTQSPTQSPSTPSTTSGEFY